MSQRLYDFSDRQFLGAGSRRGDENGGSTILFDVPHGFVDIGHLTCIDVLSEKTQLYVPVFIRAGGGDDLGLIRFETKFCVPQIPEQC